LRIGNFEHKPSVLITLLFLLFLGALLSLGTWQMMRAAEKTTILAAADRALSSQGVALTELGDLSIAARDHSRVTFSGSYEPARQFLWDNRVHKGRAGFEVITPVRTDSGLVLVNRGWVVLGSSREVLPDVSLSDALLDTPVNISGLFSRPSKGLISGEPFDDHAQWPRVMQFFDYAAIERALGEPVLAGVIQPVQPQQTDDRVNDDKVNDDKQEAARNAFYIANWEPTAAIGPARHYGYAFQWYAMAAALTILFVVYNTRRIGTD